MSGSVVVDDHEHSTSMSMALTSPKQCLGHAEGSLCESEHACDTRTHAHAHKTHIITHLLCWVSLEQVDAFVPLSHVVRVLPQHHSTQQRRAAQRQGLRGRLGSGE